MDGGKKKRLHALQADISQLLLHLNLTDECVLHQEKTIITQSKHIKWSVHEV